MWGRAWPLTLSLGTQAAIQLPALHTVDPAGRFSRKSRLIIFILSTRNNLLNI